MITLRQNIVSPSGDIINILTHIYAPAGHFTQGGHACGWHIQLGTDDTAARFTEVVDENEPHEVPSALPDIVIEEPDEEATAEDLYAALSDLGVDEND